MGGNRRCPRNGRRSQPSAIAGATVSPLLRTALEYARIGLTIFPLHPCSKIPYGKTRPEDGKPGHFCAAPLHQHGHKDATKDPTVVEAWWRAHPAANIGLATGRGLDVL